MNSFGVKTLAVIVVTIITIAAVVYGIIIFFFPNQAPGVQQLVNIPRMIDRTISQPQTPPGNSSQVGGGALSLDPTKAYVVETTILQRVRGTIKSISGDSLTLVAGSDEVIVRLDPSVEVVRRQGASLERDVKLEKGQTVEITSSYIYGRPFVGKVAVIIGQ